MGFPVAPFGTAGRTRGSKDQSLGRLAMDGAAGILGLFVESVTGFAAAGLTARLFTGSAE